MYHSQDGSKNMYSGWELNKSTKHRVEGAGLTDEGGKHVPRFEV